jgi:2-iminobutanoate/2-iminopropanoate deaminase
MVGCAQHNHIERRIYNSWERDIGYSQVVKLGDTLYVSGITSGADNFDDQLAEIYATILGILNDYGTDSNAILKEVIYTKDIEALKRAISVRKRYYNDDFFPAATWVQIDRLYMEGHLLEVEIIAYVPKK